MYNIQNENTEEVFLWYFLGANKKNEYKTFFYC